MKKEFDPALDFIRSFAKSLRDTVIVTTADLEFPGPKILYVNPTFTHVTRYSLKDVVGKTPRILQGAGTDLKELSRMRESLRDSGRFFGSILNYTKDGREIIFDWHISPIYDRDGTVKYWVSVQHGTPDFGQLTVRPRLHAMIVHRDAVTRVGLREILKPMAIELKVQELSDYAQIPQIIDPNQLPDLVLAETTRSGFGDLEELVALRRLLPNVPILVLSAVDDERTVRSALSASVNAYVNMSTPSELMVEIFRVVLAGGTYIPWEQIDSLKEKVSPVASNNHAEPTLSGLTRRQKEIGAMLAQGLSNDQIAARLGLNVVTVKGHMTRTLKALGVKNRTQAALLFKNRDL